MRRPNPSSAQVDGSGTAVASIDMRNGALSNPALCQVSCSWLPTIPLNDSLIAELGPLV